MKEKRILLTTLGSTGNNRFDYQYFYYDHNGQMSYCNSLSIAEAGTKYILSKEDIDEIIVLGSGATYNTEDALQPQKLRSFSDYSAEGIENLSEYSFFRYRIAQFVKDIDLEGADVIESIAPERQKEILEAFEVVCEQAKHMTDQNFTLKKAFHLLNKTPELQSLLNDQLEGFTNQERQWLMQYIFIKLDPVLKQHILECNEQITMCFVPTVRTRNSMLPLDNILEIVNAVYSGNPDRIHLFMDMQEIGSADGFTLISVFSMIANDATRQISIEGLITTHSLPSRFASPIDDQEMKRYDLNLLVSGMNAFIQYGKVSLIRDYWDSRHINHPRIDLMLYGMQNVSDGISLCDLNNLEYGIRILQKVFSDPDTENMPELESNIFQLISRTIQMDYGKLLSEEKINGIDLIKWAYRKKFYQQTLTIIESKIPLEMVQKGILYYAKDDETRQHMLESLQINYEDSHPTQHWSFNDPDHYFIKFYGRQKIRGESFFGDRAKAYASLRVQQLSEDHDDFVKAYSVLDEQTPLLLQFLTTYYRIGDVRNSVNHAEAKMSVISLDNIDVHAENESIAKLQKAIEDFVKIYEEVLNALSQLPPASPVQITGDEFRKWSMEHNRDNGGNWHGNGNRRGYGNRNRFGNRNGRGDRNGFDNRDRSRDRSRDDGRFDVQTQSGSITVYIGNNYLQCAIPNRPDENAAGQIFIRYGGNEASPSGPCSAQDQAQSPKGFRKKHWHHGKSRNSQTGEVTAGGVNTSAGANTGSGTNTGAGTSSDTHTK